MPRPLKFRPSLPDTKRANDAAHKMYAALSGRDTPDNVMNNVPARKTRAPSQPKQTKSEADVLRECVHMLVRHDAVELVIRANSGMAGNVEFNHLYLPVRYRAQWPANTPEVLIPDLIVLLTDGRLMAIECKEESWRRSFGESVKAVREAGQSRFLMHVQRCGGVATFATCVEDVRGVM